MTLPVHTSGRFFQSWSNPERNTNLPCIRFSKVSLICSMCWDLYFTNGALTKGKSIPLLSLLSLQLLIQCQQRAGGNGKLVCSRLSLSELTAVSMPNPDVMSNWAPQLRKAGLLLWCCKQVGQAETLPLAVCCNMQKERERKVRRIREKETRGILANPSWCTQYYLSFTLKLA